MTGGMMPTLPKAGAQDQNMCISQHGQLDPWVVVFGKQELGDVELQNVSKVSGVRLPPTVELLNAPAA